MTISILIIAHAPLASALRQCVLHVYPDVGREVLALDVAADESTDLTRAAAQTLLQSLAPAPVLVMTDVFGATPCNVAQKVVDGQQSKLVAGVNLPMLLRTVNYRQESLELLLARAVAGGTQGIMQVTVTAPQNQARITHDHLHHDYQQ